MKMQEISDRIDAHLKRFEADPEINALNKYKTKPYYGAGSFYGAGSKIGVSYVSYQGTTFLSKSDALEYLKWLDAGNIGRHYKALSFNTRLGK
jgi:hypothetical protein